MPVTRKKADLAEDNQIDKERGLRLRYARGLALLSRKDLSQLIDYTERSQFSWEEGDSPISDKIAFKVIHALQKHNVKCSYEWLMDGVGESPQRIENLQNLILDSALIEADGQLIFETDIMLFKKRYPDSLVLEIRDDKAVPRYYRGDFLFAPRISQSKFKEHWSMGYLYEVEPSVFFPASIRKETEQSYSVESLHHNTQEKLCFKGVSPEYFYPIISVKRKFFSAY